MTREYTIGRLAKTVGLSRSTLLYYDRIGLLQPVNRSSGDYRLYSDKDAERLRQICAFREMGIPLKQVSELIDGGDGDTATIVGVLQRHLQSLESEIEALHRQRRQVVLLLNQIVSRTPHRGIDSRKVRRPGAQSKNLVKPVPLKEDDMINKDRWVEIMRAAGLTEDDMHNWHRQFERLEPDAHQEFLESLGIEAEEIRRIRDRFK